VNARAIAIAGTLLMLVVVAASAFLRLGHAGAACPDWPACAEIDTHEAITIAVAIARTAHRLSASAIAVLLIGLLIIARTQRPRLVGQAWLAAAGLAIAIALALLGMQMRHAAPGSAPPAVNLANLAGGYALLAIMATSWAASIGTPAVILAQAGIQPRKGDDAEPLLSQGRPPFLAWLLIASLAAAALASVCGALAGSGVAGMQTFHRAVGWAVVALVGVLLLVLRRAPATLQRWRVLLVALWLAQPALGIVQAYVAPSVAIALAHNVAAGALVAALAAATYRAFAACRRA
jgi:heme A synthase